MEPGAERAVPAKGPDAAPRPHEDVLGKIFRIAATRGQHTRQADDRRLVTPDQLVERLPAAAGGRLDQRAVRIHFG